MCSLNSSPSYTRRILHTELRCSKNGPHVVNAFDVALCVSFTCAYDVFLSRVHECGVAIAASHWVQWPRFHTHASPYHVFVTYVFRECAFVSRDHVLCKCCGTLYQKASITRSDVSFGYIWTIGNVRTFWPNYVQLFSDTMHFHTLEFHSWFRMWCHENMQS